MAKQTVLTCIKGASAGREVLLGFASARDLYASSFADVLDEATGRGYQRRFSPQHSLDFRRYIQKPGSATIPLTFNLRPRDDAAWRLEEVGRGMARLLMVPGIRVLSQVDCQHRLGYLTDQDIELPFMCFIGLTEREETAIFDVINGKAKGLSKSLLDYHEAKLSENLSAERPELFVALFLNSEPTSPWCQRLDIGGEATSGLERRASLRTMQKAAKQFVKRVRAHYPISAEDAALAVRNFWIAVVQLLPLCFSKPRSYLITKGIGVYALMEIAADLLLEHPLSTVPQTSYFASLLGDFAVDFDWSNNGPLRGLGGQGGVKEALCIIRDARRRARLKVANG
ncbi:DGQHR domain-containing protein [Rhizobium laguerreae]|uniref:DGQHR domain-containing protein n=1 Tax=Rhizobium laguerreae TaxID=1076926 RepID=UPI001C928B7E|nr:DGQHR domain-containing protein [Rhizobium laguerreae]MBY3090190.1 DGQHR domain-containing protein [Rhizobium laguerreae]